MAGVPPSYVIIPYGRGLPLIRLQERVTKGIGWITKHELSLERTDGLGLAMFFDLELETPDSVLESGNMKRYKEGFRFRAELAWKEFYAERIAGFLAKLHNWLGETGKNRKIRFWPHVDVSLSHDIYEEKGWDYPYLLGRWVGFDGVVVLRGVERYNEMPYATTYELQSPGPGRWDVKLWSPVATGNEDYELIWQ